MAAKTRIVIRAGKDEIELFSLRERADGDLVILGNLTAEVEPVPGEGYVPVSQNRFSIHTSEDLLGFTIKHTLTLSDGQTISSASFIRSLNKQLTWIVLGKRYPLHSSKSVVEPKKNDRVFCINSYNPETHSLLLFLSVTAAGQNMKFSQRNINYSQIGFRRFIVHFAHFFIPCPAFHQGEEVVTNTTPIRINGVSGEGPRYENRGSMTQEQLDAVMQVTLEQLSEAFVNKVLAFADDQGPFTARQIRNFRRRARDYSKSGK